MAPHSSVLAWRIPGTAESGGLPSMGSHRVGHDLAAAAVADFIMQISKIKNPQKKKNPLVMTYYIPLCTQLPTSTPMSLTWLFLRYKHDDLLQR